MDDTLNQIFVALMAAMFIGVVFGSTSLAIAERKTTKSWRILPGGVPLGADRRPGGGPGSTRRTGSAPWNARRDVPSV
ncbi:hypothetical protein [Nocardia sp. NPDC004415]